MDEHFAPDGAPIQYVRSPFDVEEVRDSGAGDGQWTFRGHAAVFNTWTDLSGGQGWFMERVAPGFFDDILATNPDVHCTREHNFEMVLGRTTSKTCELRTDGRGLHVWNRTAPTTYGNDLRVLMERGDVDQMSFMFTVASDGSEWAIEDGAAPDGGDLIRRTLLKCGGLYDVTVCAQGAYPTTDAQIASRSRRALVSAPDDVRKLLRSRITDLASERSPEETPAPDQGGTPVAPDNPVGEDRTRWLARADAALKRASTDNP